jgi:hypothetical protein
MSNAATTDREYEALTNMGLKLTRKAAATAIPSSHPARKRPPLGLKPIHDDNEQAPGHDRLDTNGERQAHQIVASSVSRLSTAALDAPITWRSAFEDILETALAGVFDGDEAVFKCVTKLRERVSELEGTHRNELAELRLALTEARCEIREMKAIQENARTLSRGEQGVAGPRGIPGPPGEARVGPAGPRGEPAPMIAAWEPDAARFVLTPVHSDGSRGVPQNLRSLFEAYDQSTNGDEE